MSSTWPGSRGSTRENGRISPEILRRSNSVHHEIVCKEVAGGLEKTHPLVKARSDDEAPASHRAVFDDSRQYLDGETARGGKVERPGAVLLARRRHVVPE